MEFCQNNNRIQAENKLMEMDTFFQVSDYLGNRHIFGTYRLKIFVHLSMTKERDSLQLDLRKLDTSFGSGLTTRSSGQATSALTPLSPHAPAALTPPSNYKFRAINTATGVQVVETASLASEAVRPRATTLESVETAQSTGVDDVSFLSDLTGFGGQTPDMDDYFFGDLPDPSRGPVNLRSASADMRWEAEQGRAPWDQRQGFQRNDRPFSGGFSPSRPAALPQSPMSYPQYRDQGALPFSPRASPAGGYGSYLSPQARPFSPRSPRQQPSYTPPPPPQYGGYDRDLPAPYPSQSRYQPRAPSLPSQYAAQQQESMSYQGAPSPARPVLSPGGRYVITPPEPLEAPMPSMAAPVQRLLSPHAATAGASSTMSVGGSYVITPPAPEPSPGSTQDPYFSPTGGTEPGHRPEDPLEQDWSLVDDATTFANTRANFHLTLPPTAVPVPTHSSSATAAVASPKHTKTVMWADQTDQAAKEDDGVSVTSAASTSSISKDSAQDQQGANEFDILQQAAELGSGTDRDDWQFTPAAVVRAAVPSAASASGSSQAVAAPAQLSMSWLQDEEDFRVDLLGALQCEDDLDDTEDEGGGGVEDSEKVELGSAGSASAVPSTLFSAASQGDAAAPSLLDTLSAASPLGVIHQKQEVSPEGCEQLLDATPLPAWLTAASPPMPMPPVPPTTTDMFRSLDMQLHDLGLDGGDGGDDMKDTAEPEGYLCPTLSLSLSPVQDQCSEGSGQGNSGANSPFSPHHEAWPEPGTELASSGREGRDENRFYSARSRRLSYKD